MMPHLVLLDLFCGAGGSALGYIDAGFDVVGVDNRPQPNYPGRFVLADWRDGAEAVLAAAQRAGSRVAAIHASPPCQGYSVAVKSENSVWAGTAGRAEPRLLGDVRAYLQDTGLPWVMENVVGSQYDRQLRPRLLLCGTMFGLPLARHRLFESSIAVPQPWHPTCEGVAVAYARRRGWDTRDMSVTGKGRRAGTKERWMEIMGWPPHVPVSQHGLREAIPPAYARHVGAALMEVVR